MGKVTIWHVLGANQFWVASEDGSQVQALAGKPEARRLSARRGYPIAKIEQADWEAQQKAWDAMGRAKRIPPKIISSPEQAFDAAKALFDAGATAITLNALTAARKGPPPGAPVAQVPQAVPEPTQAAPVPPEVPALAPAST